MMNDIITLAKLEAGQISSYDEEIDLETFFQKLLSEIQSYTGDIGRDGISFRVVHECDFAKIRTDVNLLHTVFLHLLTNAVNFCSFNSMAFPTASPNG